MRVKRERQPLRRGSSLKHPAKLPDRLPARWRVQAGMTADSLRVNIVDELRYLKRR
jgi:hypothetical protein